MDFLFKAVLTPVLVVACMPGKPEPALESQLKWETEREGRREPRRVPRRVPP